MAGTYLVLQRQWQEHTSSANVCDRNTLRPPTSMAGTYLVLQRQWREYTSSANACDMITLHPPTSVAGTHFVRQRLKQEHTSSANVCDRNTLGPPTSVAGTHLVRQDQWQEHTSSVNVCGYMYYNVRFVSFKYTKIILELHTIKPISRGHVWDNEKSVLSDRWPLKRGSIHIKFSMTGLAKVTF
jgi:hypothetical protein